MDAATVTALCTGIVSIIAAVFAGLTSLKNGKKLDVVQEQTNGHLSVLTARNEQLTATLTDAAVPVPLSPAVVVVEPPAV